MTRIFFFLYVYDDCVYDELFVLNDYKINIIFITRPYRHKPRKLLPPLWPKNQRSTKTTPGRGATPIPFSFIPPYSLWMEPPPYGYLFSPYTRVLPEPTGPQSSQPAASPHPSQNVKIRHIVLTLDCLSYLFDCFIVLITPTVLTMTTSLQNLKPADSAKPLTGRILVMLAASPCFGVAFLFLEEIC